MEPLVPRLAQAGEAHFFYRGWDKLPRKPLYFMVKTCKKTWFRVSGEDFRENQWMLNVSCGWIDQNWRLNEDEWSWIDLGSFIERCIDQNRFAPTSMRCEAQQKTLRSNLFTPTTQLYQYISPPARWGLLDFITVVLLFLLGYSSPPPSPPPPPPLPPPPVSPRPCLHQLPPSLPPCQLFAKLFANFRAQSAPLDLNLGPSQLSVHRWTSTWELPRSVCTAGPQPGTFPAQCAPLDLNLGPWQLSVHRWTSTWDLPSSVCTAGPQRSDRMPEGMPDRMPDKTSDRRPEDMPDKVPECLPDRIPEGMPDRVPDKMSDRRPEDMPDKVPECLPDRIPEDMPDRVPDNMPEDMPDRMPDRMPKDMPEHMPEDLPDNMPEDMPDRMPDRMPEDLPVTTGINVMVGITRSKVFFPGGWIPVRVLCILAQKCHKDFGHMVQIAKSLRAPTGGSSWKLKLLTST